MILAEKIVCMRKKYGWSQEELAEKVNVSRQSISKWESAQSIPDLDKILKLCDIFEVSADYLLRDEVEEDVAGEDSYVPQKERRISVEYANEFMEKKKKSAFRIAVGVIFCILSPINLIFLAGCASCGYIGENAAAAAGLGTLLLMVVAAVVIFVLDGNSMSEYEWLQKESFTLEYGVSGIVEEKMKKQKKAYGMAMAAGVGLCILGAMAVVVTGTLDAGEMAVVCGVDALLLLVSAGVFLIVKYDGERDAFLQLLQLGDYTQEKKAASFRMEMVGAIYWLTMVSIYLASSFITGKWESTWIIWPVAGTFYGVVAAVAGLISKKSK